jgi:hypothetical protein
VSNGFDGPPKFVRLLLRIAGANGPPKLAARAAGANVISGPCDPTKILNCEVDDIVGMSRLRPTANVLTVPKVNDADGTEILPLATTLPVIVPPVSGSLVLSNITIFCEPLNAIPFIVLLLSSVDADDAFPTKLLA